MLNVQAVICFIIPVLRACRPISVYTSSSSTTRTSGGGSGHGRSTTSGAPVVSPLATSACSSSNQTWVDWNHVCVYSAEKMGMLRHRKKVDTVTSTQTLPQLSEIAVASFYQRLLTWITTTPSPTFTPFCYTASHFGITYLFETSGPLWTEWPQNYLKQ